MSHHNQRVKDMKCPSNLIQKVDIQEVIENGVVFQDGSYEQVDSILYCTGERMTSNAIDLMIYTYLKKKYIYCKINSINNTLILF